MKFQGCLLAVKDMAVSKQFYEEVLHQPVLMDLGVHVSFGGFGLQQGYGELVGVPPDSVHYRTNNFQVYFEVEDLDAVVSKLKGHAGLEWVHGIREFPWGQRDARLYDPDGHIVEIAEEMGVVIRRFLALGMTAEAVAQHTMCPIEMVKEYL